MSRTDGGLSPATRREVDAFLDRWRVRRDVPGASVAIVDADELLYAAGLGARDVEVGAPATPDTRYPFASTTKVVTAMVVLQLVEAGALGLDDEIREYVDTWSAAPGEPIAVRELLTHTSGVPADEEGPRNYLFDDAPPASPIVTRADRRRHLDGAAEDRIVDEERFMYGDASYAVLGEVVEAVDGRSYATVVREELFEPLGMEGATIGYGELADVDDAATGYTVADGVPSPTSLNLERDADGLGPASPAGLLASVTDVGRLLRCLLGGGELEGTRVLGEDHVAAMCSHQAPTHHHVDGTPRGCGYGPRITEWRGERLVEHSGTAPGVGRAYLGLLQESGVGVALATNTADVPIGALGNGVLALAVGERPVETVPYLAVREKVRAVAGTYESRHRTTVVQVEPAGGDAYVEATAEAGGDWSLPAFPETLAHDDYRFTTVLPAGLQRTLSFHRYKSGMELRFGAHRLRRTPHAR